MAAQLFPELQFNDNITGAPLASGKVYTYVAGTLTPLATYTDNTAGTSVGTYVTLDSNGRPNNGNGIWLLVGSNYKFIIKDSSGTTVQTIDNIAGSGFAGTSAFVTVGADSTLSGSRAITAGNGISLTDAGAGSTLTVTTLQSENQQSGASYTAVAADHGKTIHFTGTGNNPTLSLTAAATLGSGWYCNIMGPTAGTITIDPNGAETVNASSTIAVPGSGAALRLVCDGTSFWLSWSLLPVLNAVSLAGYQISNTTGGYLCTTGTFQTTSGNIQTGTGTVSTTGRLIGGQLELNAPQTANLTANTNDLALTKSAVLLTTTGAWDLTGMVPSSATNGCVVILLNTSANTVTIKNESASSTAGNRFKNSTGADLSLTTNKSQMFVYDTTALRWRNVCVA